MSQIVLTPETLASMLRGETVGKRDAWRQTPLAPEIDAYISWKRAKGHNAKATENAEYVLSTMALYFCDKQLADLSGKQGRRLLVEFLNRAYPEDKVNEATRGTYVNYLRSFFKWCYLEETIDRNPTDGLEKPRRKERRYVLLTDAELERLFTMQPPRDEAALRLCYDLALRKNDLRTLQCGAIDVFAGTVDLLNGKNGTRRILPILEKETKLALQRHFAALRPDPEEYLLHPVKRGRRGEYPDYVSVTLWEDRLSPMHSNTVQIWWEECCKRAGIERKPGEKRLHDLRHKRITDLDAAGKDGRAISVYARHSNPVITQTYIHRMNQTEWLRRKLA